MATILLHLAINVTHWCRLSWQPLDTTILFAFGKQPAVSATALCSTLTPRQVAPRFVPVTKLTWMPKCLLKDASDRRSTSLRSQQTSRS